jgi:O-antigen ligase
MEKKIATCVLILASFISIFTFPSTDVLDINSWRLLIFSAINTISLAYIFFNNDLSDSFLYALKSKIGISIAAFIVWGLSSYFYALNQNEVIIRSMTFVNFYVSFLTLYTFVTFNKFKPITIAIFISLVVGCQLLLSYNALYDITRVRPYDFSFNNFLVGIFPNRNITSAMYLFQLPFVLYVFVSSKFKSLKLFSAILSFLLLNMVFLMGSRTAYVILTAVCLAFFISFIVLKNNELRSYFKIYFIVLIAALLFSTFSLGTKNDAFIANRVSTIDFTEESTNTRLRYYRHGSNQLFNNPLIGVGLGNWKIVSVEKEKDKIISYIVPYTMHNDFLEVASELGVIGLIIFILIFYFALKNSWNLFSRIKSDPIVLVGPTMLMIYIIDSNLNFPFTRSSQLFYLSFVLALSLYYKKYYNEINK